MDFLKFLEHPSSHALTLAVGYLLCHFLNVVRIQKQLDYYQGLSQKALEQDIAKAAKE